MPSLKNPIVSSDDPYAFSTMWVNGRDVSIDRIRRGEENGRTPFEESTFRFIREWLDGKESFQLNTSGSTGTPKTISVSRKQMVMSALKTAEKIGLQKNSIALICIDTRYIGGKMMLVRSLTLGLQMMAVDPSSNPLVKIPVDKWVQFAAFVPYQISAMLESKHPHLLNNLSKVLIGGASLHYKYSEQLEHYQCECYETYGMTETVSHVALRLVNTPGKQQYLETLPGVEITLDDRGCLAISADYLPEPVVTNDLVEIVSSDKFRWIGRWDSIINTGGVKVIPEKIEKALEIIFKQQQFHHRFFIAAFPDEKLTNKLVLILEGVQISSEPLRQSLAVLKSTVSPFEFPKEIYTTPRFILTQTQKIDRKQTLAGVSLHTAHL